MDKNAFKQYILESDNWLHKSRRDLMIGLLERYIDIQNNLTILEIGAGVGQNTIFLQRLGQVDVIEVNEDGLKALRLIPNIRKIIPQPIPFTLNDKYDLVVAMDVLEHIEDDRSTVRWISDQLNTGGYLFITLPAQQWLYSEHDIAVHHIRRYSQSSLKQILPDNIKILKIVYFNTTLFPIVALSRIYKNLLMKLKKQKYFKAKKQSNLMPRPVDRILRIILKFEIKLINKGFNPPFGLSIFCIAKKI